MLPDATVPASLLAVLGSLRGCFTYPGFTTFAALVTGLIANTGRGTVTGMLLGANLTRHWSHDRAHAFFARASWDAQTLGAALSHLVVRHLVPDGAPLTVAVDDTLFKRRGKKVFGACWQHDGSATGRDGIGYGTCFVVLGLIVDLPFLTRPLCLPIAARLHRPRQGPTKVELAASRSPWLPRLGPVAVRSLPILRQHRRVEFGFTPHGSRLGFEHGCSRPPWNSRRPPDERKSRVAMRSEIPDIEGRHLVIHASHMLDELFGEPDMVRFHVVREVSAPKPGTVGEQ
jgi:hypothetical protein